MKCPILRSLVVLFAFGFAVTALPAADPPAKAEATPSTPSKGALPMEFDNYFVVLLVRPADAPEFPKDELDRIQAGHFANIQRLAAEKKIAYAGPFEDFSGRNVRGMFILRTASIDEAKAWVESDPAVKAGRLKPEFLKWYVEKGALK
jgi:uncharacterized protein YciI